ncbi:MAG TPA: aminotransferase [Methylomirabilota bacterium]|jgi:adenosylmethionine-8-amino-7-oxononanoate aminotransferase
MSTTADRPSVVKQDLANVIHPIVPHKQLEEHQLVIVSGKDSTVVDADGREYLDGMAGLWCVNIGYGRTELADVAAAQMRQLSYYPHTAMNRPAAALAEKVNGLLGGDNHVYFVSSGSEANEAAFKFARQYGRHEFPRQNRYKTISRYYGYHGTTLATLSAGGMGDRKMKFEPLSGNDFVHVAPPYCYRCPFGLEPKSCDLACVKNMETTIQGEGPETVAEVIIEPVMSAVGVAVPPDDYLPAVADLCRKHGALLHVDEVINGFGRTGRLFAHEHSAVKPDIVTVAKGISSAYLPMAATVVRNSVFQSFLGDAAADRQVNQVNTYGGHPAAAAVALRNIEILLEEKLVERSAENGAYLLDGLRTLTRHRWVGDVRGRGLYAGVELVTDRTSKAVMPAAQIKRIVERCQERGVIVGRSGGGRHLGNTIVLAPPLVLTRGEIDRIVSVLDQTIPEICPEAGA